MKYYFILVLLIELIQFCSCEAKFLKRQKVLTRKKRYLSFPEGSSIVVSNSGDQTLALKLERQNNIYGGKGWVWKA